MFPDSAVSHKKGPLFVGAGLMPNTSFETVVGTDFLSFLRRTRTKRRDREQSLP